MFDHLGAHRASVECDDTNVRGIRVVERCGLIREGHIRENKRNADGTLSGTLRFGLLRDEFEATRGGPARLVSEADSVTGLASR